MNRFNALNTKLQSLLEEQTDLDLLLNPLINWKDDMTTKNWLDLKYAGREFDISHKWKELVQLEKEKKLNNGNWDEEILKANEEKKTIYIKLKKRLEEINHIIQKLIEELLPEDSYENAEEIFK